MDTNPTFNEKDLIDILSLIIPKGCDIHSEYSDSIIDVSNTDGNITVNIQIKQPEETYDDSEIRDLVTEFKDSINNLDDSIFLESIEKVKEAIDVKRFDELLNLEKYSEAEATEVACLIDYFSQIISTTLQDKIEELISSSKRF